MYQHRRARENESTVKPEGWQRSWLRNRLDRAEKGVVSKGRVRVSMGATNGVRVSYGVEGAVVATGATGRPSQAHGEREALSLVYSAKVQDKAGLMQASSMRRRGSILTGYAAHKVREACAVIEEKYDRHAYFVTLTVPGSTREALDTVAKHSSQILNAYMQNFRDSRQFELDACGVWEFQKRGALHLHLLIGVKDERQAVEWEKKHRKWWRKVLLHYSKKTGIDLFARANGGTWKNYRNKPRTEWARVKKSVGRYMSKYLAKDARKGVPPGTVPPASWIYVSAPVWEEVKARRRVEAYRLVSPEAAEREAAHIAAMARDCGATVLVTRNPFNDQACGFMLYFDNERKSDFFERVSERLRELYPWRMYEEEQQAEWSGAHAELVPGWKRAELIFDGKALPVEQEEHAELLRPLLLVGEGRGDEVNSLMHNEAWRPAFPGLELRGA